MVEKKEKVKLQQRHPKKYDPSLPSTAPKPFLSNDDFGHEPKAKKFIDHFYNAEKKEYCGRTCEGWVYIILYAIIYVMFLAGFTLLLLYVSLQLLKYLVVFRQLDTLTYPKGGIGLTAVPTSEDSYPLIWYKHGESEDYNRYVKAIDKFFSINKKQKESGVLGPCGEYPYGYGENPCIIIKVNRFFHWSGKPLQPNSTVTAIAPPEVKKWMSEYPNKLWLQCNGYHSYDQEHIGNIKYYPDPPGFDPSLFPLDFGSQSPLVALQISGFTIGVSLAIECNLWFEHGPSSVDFVIYVAPDDSIAFTGQTSVNV